MHCACFEEDVHVCLACHAAIKGIDWHLMSSHFFAFFPMHTLLPYCLTLTLLKLSVISSYSVKVGLSKLWERVNPLLCPPSLPPALNIILTKWGADVRKLFAINLERGFLFSSMISLWDEQKPSNQLSVERWLAQTLVGTCRGTCAFVWLLH